MDPSSFVPIAAAIVGASALLLAGDLLTVTARLRRKLDKELAIADRLPPGEARKEIEALTRRHALELSYREGHKGRTLLVVLILVAIAVVVGGWIATTKPPDFKLDPDSFEGSVLPWLLGLLLFVGLPATVFLIIIDRKDRISHVEEFSAEVPDGQGSDSPETGPAPT